MTANSNRDKAGAVAVELRLDRISQLYNSLDPAPFVEKELDPSADEYIVGSAEDLAGRHMRLVIILPEKELARPESAQIPASIRNHFALREQSEQRKLRTEWRRGRMNLYIGLGFLVVCLGVRELLSASGSPVFRVVDEGLLIAGWVALWGPLDFFLYGWWPITTRRRLFTSLAKLDVELRALK